MHSGASRSKGSSTAGPDASPWGPFATFRAAQLARHAENVFLFQGRHVLGARLIYHALLLDPKNWSALQRLSDFMDSKGTEQLSAAVLEYMLAPDVGALPEVRQEVDNLLFLCKWTWGFSRHRSGRPDLAGEDFRDRRAFTVDEARYRQEFLDPVVSLGGGSLAGAVRATHALAGRLGGLLRHREYTRNVPLEEIFHPERYVRTPEYDLPGRGHAGPRRTRGRAATAHPLILAGPQPCVCTPWAWRVSRTILIMLSGSL